MHGGAAQPWREAALAFAAARMALEGLLEWSEQAQRDQHPLDLE